MHIIINDVEHISQCLLAICVSFGESLFWSSVHFLTVMFDYLILSCMSYLYVLVINPLSVALFENIFSHYVDCLFFLFMVFFAVQKLLSLIWSYLFIFVLFNIFITVGDTSKKYHYNLCERVFCMFSSRSFIVSCCTCRSLIHLSLFLYMMLQNVLLYFFYM